MGLTKWRRWRGGVLLMIMVLSVGVVMSSLGDKEGGNKQDSLEEGGDHLEIPNPHSQQHQQPIPERQQKEKVKKKVSKSQLKKQQAEARVEDELASLGLLDDYDIEYKTPTPSELVYFYETFDDINRAKSRWIPSLAQKEDNENLFKYDGKWDFDLPDHRMFPNDHALILRSRAKHAAISTKLDRKFEFNKNPLIFQYEVTFQNGMDCGGAYIKLLSESKDMRLEEFNDKTPYTIMFGPDKCGSDIKLHFIFRHRNPLNGTFEEKHAKRPSNHVEDAFTDKKPHLYRLVLNPDNRFEVFVDGLLINQGNLLEDMEPPVNPPIEIEDPDDAKPYDWDEREKIPDENAAKPVGWDEEAPSKIPDPNAKVPAGWLEDEPEMIHDPNAVRPEDWDESMDGNWEAPFIPNPKCEEAVGCGTWQAPLVENPGFKGRWQAPLVENPNFKGKWSRRMIPNPDYFEDREPFKMSPIGAVGLEIWTMTDNVLFDNFIVSDKERVVNDFTERTYQLKMRVLERNSKGVFERIINYSNSRPWLYAVYMMVIGLPLALIIAFCCGGSSKDEKSDLKESVAEGGAFEGDEKEEGTGDSEQLLRGKKKVKVQVPLKVKPVKKKRGAASKDDLEKEQPKEGESQKGEVDTLEEDEEKGDGHDEAEGEEAPDAAPEPVNKLIPEKRETMENTQLKKRRTRRD